MQNRSIERLAIALVICSLGILMFSATSVGKEPVRALEEVPTVLTATPGVPNVAPEEVLPDPCGLAAVVCPGEEAKPLTPYVRPTYREVTAYTSTPEQTDSTPCIGADGTNLCERWQEGETLCAANFVPLGTILLLDNQEEADGEDAIVCTVADRLSSRFPNRVDLYMGYDTAAAWQFGIKTLFVKEYGQGI